MNFWIWLMKLFWEYWKKNWKIYSSLLAVGFVPMVLSFVVHPIFAVSMPFAILLWVLYFSYLEEVK